MMSIIDCMVAATVLTVIALAMLGALELVNLLTVLVRDLWSWIKRRDA